MLHLARKSIGTYVALAHQTGLTAPDCPAVALLLVKRRKPDEALVWIERGIDLDASPARVRTDYTLAKP